MNSEIKQRWVDALRSGQYKQGQFCLCSEVDIGQYAYCCLGVLAKVLEDDFKVGKLDYKLKETEQHFEEFYNPDVAYHFLEFLPLPQTDTAELSMEDQATLANMNDKKTSFNEIADYIEEKF